MTKRERVLNSLFHKPVDRVPKGETWIDGNLANKIMGTNFPTDYQHYEREKNLINMLNIKGVS
jgi:uroporphyrinogen decarboxylase